MSYFAAARACENCAGFLPYLPKPIIQGCPSSQLLIVGQAPGIRAHDSNKPWNDASGVRLRSWLGMSEKAFYDEQKVAILPMGFCYPGKVRSGDTGHSTGRKTDLIAKDYWRLKLFFVLFKKV